MSGVARYGKSNKCPARIQHAAGGANVCCTTIADRPRRHGMHGCSLDISRVAWTRIVPRPAEKQAGALESSWCLFRTIPSPEFSVFFSHLATGPDATGRLIYRSDLCAKPHIAFRLFKNAGRDNPMIRVGIAGIGFMGMIHYLAYQKAQGRQSRGDVRAGPHAAGRRLAHDQRQLRPGRQEDGSCAGSRNTNNSMTCWPIRKST